MADVIIFGGTTEGRLLAEYAHENQVCALVSVASEYGSSLLPDSPWVRSRSGRLDEEQMKLLFSREAPKLVLDATHPHAALVSETVKQACAAMGICCLRVLREGTQEESSGAAARIYRAETVREAAKLLKKDRAPVLLTTGSKELNIFVEELGGTERIYARVLPDARVLENCKELGLKGHQLIAMQGPFSVEMNCALIHMTGAGWLVTKESGTNSGYEEKLQAASQCGIPAIVIRKPSQEQGVSLEQARERMLQWSRKDSARKGSRQIALIGMGMGGGNQLTAEAIRALRKAHVIFGAKRMLTDVEAWIKGKPLVACYRTEEIMAWLEEHLECQRAAVVYSGDTGFHSGSASMLRRLAENKKAVQPCEEKMAEDERSAQPSVEKTAEEGWQVRVFPGISTVSCLCARFCTSYEDLYLASAHGQDCAIEELLRRHRRVFLLLGEPDGIARLCRRLCAAGRGEVRVYAGIRLGYPEERLLTGTAEELCQVQTDALAAVILERCEEGHHA